LKEAQALYDRAHASGADFAALAKEKSDDEATKAKGGDLGWVSVSATSDTGPARSPELLSTLYQLKKGQVSKPFPTGEGYVIVKATDERPYASLKKDAKDKTEDESSYKEQVGTAIATGHYAMLKR